MVEHLPPHGLSNKNQWLHGEALEVAKHVTNLKGPFQRLAGFWFGEASLNSGKKSGKNPPNARERWIFFCKKSHGILRIFRIKYHPQKMVLDLGWKSTSQEMGPSKLLQKCHP